MGPKSRFSLLFVILLLFISAGLLSCQGQTASDNTAAMAPDFTLKDLDGNFFRLSGTKGKVVILDFWATWCPPCRMELPHFQSLYEEYKGKGLVIVGVALDRGGTAVVRSFTEAGGITYPIVIGDQRIASTYGGIRGIPTTFVIDRQGRIVEKFVGYRGREVFESLIRKLL
ncbi:MAG: hypothetical protein DRP85_06270 [Candidatus Makaraimicrobium thalassicum]|nr:MAG: hypothetical protein DRP85_06270 [Candidatus Omnitrophota bacterium]